MKRVCELHFEGRIEEAAELGRELEDVYDALSITSNPIPVKAAMGLLGFGVGDPRLPLVPATGMQLERLRAMLERHQLLGTHV